MPGSSRVDAPYGPYHQPHNTHPSQLQQSQNTTTPLAPAGSPKGKKAKETNPVLILYDRAFNMGAGRWLSGAFVLGFSAGIISKKPTGMLLAVSTYNLACASLHVFLVGPTIKPISPSNMKPPAWYFVVLSASSIMWLIAFPLMFVVRSDAEQYVVLDLRKRAAIGHIAGLGLDTIQALENITMACACFGVSAFILCLAQWYYVFKIVRGSFKTEEMREAFEKVMKKR
ncbi:hypothetical protein SODALDRAFT_327010 [Sodiomyces alkalinus F11]|uniref:MARVEL domain-containing protein n=1 Tax=Sodiomyces alkalinus (strain CBS 110278 / VKM F-3762 / F11) TaxID=1314773 RepID=A0A3N2Q7V6_SODAK|nr:hypothetical protein SODALDRAFT_327010 [Sodiomyces alkalinus F11]ROT42853.1 hypothetical protein SODALDRAFT_327010 [Sodiomyces alkalinus F11]